MAALETTASSVSTAGEAESLSHAESEEFHHWVVEISQLESSPPSRVEHKPTKKYWKPPIDKIRQKLGYCPPPHFTVREGRTDPNLSAQPLFFGERFDACGGINVVGGWG